MVDLPTVGLRISSQAKQQWKGASERIRRQCRLRIQSDASMTVYWGYAQGHPVIAAIPSTRTARSFFEFNFKF